MNVYCHADAAEQAPWFGDDIGFKGDGVGAAGHEHGPDDRLDVAPGRLARHGIDRARRLARFPVPRSGRWSS